MIPTVRFWNIFSLRICFRAKLNDVQSLKKQKFENQSACCSTYSIKGIPNKYKSRALWHAFMGANKIAVWRVNQGKEGGEERTCLVSQDADFWRVARRTSGT